MVSRLRSFHLFPFLAPPLALLYYGQFLQNFFAFDDFKYLDNMYRGGVDLLTGYGSLRIVSNLSWWPLFQACGYDQFGYNFFGLCFFCANSILLYVLLVRLVPGKTVPFLASFFFVTGSAGADAVLWKATNSSVIALFFYLGSMILYVDYRRDGDPRRYWYALGLFVAAMFSKEEAASFPLTAALVDTMFLGGGSNPRCIARRLLPFCGIVCAYLAVSSFTFNVLLGARPEPEKLFLFRPLYSLAGWATSFFLSPDGFLRGNSPPVYLTGLFIVLAFLLKDSRRLLLFGILWAFLAFLPQSLTGLGQFEPRSLANSISRYLYITSIGSAIVFAAVLDGLRRRIAPRAWYPLAACMLALFVWVHYPQVQARGQEWRDVGIDVEEFLVRMKSAAPFLPAPSYIHVVNRPTGRGFMEQALRAWYGNPKINYVEDVVTAKREGKSPLYLVVYQPVEVDPIVIRRLN